MQHLYPMDINPAEETAGFRLAEIENPDGHCRGCPPTLRAVVYPVDPCHRLVKMTHPTESGRHYYALQVFGGFGFDPQGKRSRWLYRHADYREDDPARVTAVAASWLRDHPDSRYVAADPSAQAGGQEP